MNTRERNAVISHFQAPSPAAPRILLLSLRAGMASLLLLVRAQDLMGG